MATAAVTYNLSPSALQKYLSIEDLPRIPEHQWPRQEAKLTRLGTSDCVNIPYEVSIPSTEFVNDPTNTHRNLPEFTEERSRMLHGLISSVLSQSFSRLDNPNIEQNTFSSRDFGIWSQPPQKNPRNLA